MTRIHKIWTDLEELATNAKVVDYWEKRQNIILETLKTTQSDFEKATIILLRIVSSLNEEEKKYSTYHLYMSGFISIEKDLPKSENLNELKFELAKGLLLNRQYEHSKRLFDDLATTSFDRERFEEMWFETVKKNSGTKNWLSLVVIPGILRLSFIFAYITFAILTSDFYFSTTIFILTLEIFDRWNHRKKINKSFNDYENDSLIEQILKRHKRNVLYPLGLVLLFYPIYYFDNQLLVPLVLITGISFPILLSINSLEDIYYSIWVLNKRKFQAKKNTTR